MTYLFKTLLQTNTHSM